MKFNPRLPKLITSPNMQPGSSWSAAGSPAPVRAQTTTWNPLDKSANMGLTNGNLTAQLADPVSAGGVRSTTSYAASTKRYFEVLIDATTNSAWPITGLADAGCALTAIGTNPNSLSLYINRTLNGSGSFTASGAQASFTSPIVGDIIGWAVDFIAGKVFVSKNGVYDQGGDPVAGTSPSFTFTPQGTAFFIANGGKNVNTNRAILATWETVYGAPNGAGWKEWDAE